jgi:hypothetical protein
MVRMAYEYYCLLVCVGVYCYEYSPISWKNLLPPSLGLYFLQNFGEFLQNHTLSHPGLHKHKSISSNYFFPLFLLKVKGHPMICLSKHRVSLGAGRGWLFSTTPPPLCHRHEPVLIVHGLDGHRKFLFRWTWLPGPSRPCHVFIPTALYQAPHFLVLHEFTLAFESCKGSRNDRKTFS